MTTPNATSRPIVCPLTLPSRQAPFIRVFAGRCGFSEGNPTPYRLRSACVVLNLHNQSANMTPNCPTGHVANSIVGVNGYIGTGEKLVHPEVACANSTPTQVVV